LNIANFIALLTLKVDWCYCVKCVRS